MATAFVQTLGSAYNSGACLALSINSIVSTTLGLQLGFCLLTNLTVQEARNFRLSALKV